jgi:CHAT domain-containing protein
MKFLAGLTPLAMLPFCWAYRKRNPTVRGIRTMPKGAHSHPVYWAGFVAAGDWH